MMRIAFLKYGQWTRSTEIALFCSILNTAVSMQIPLVFLGENPALAFGAKAGSDDWQANGLRAYDTLSTSSLSGWEQEGISREKLILYDFPTEEELEAIGFRAIYLGYFFRDFHDLTNTELAQKNGLVPRIGQDADPLRTGNINPYESVDEDFLHVNQYLKYIKLGFGKVVQQVSVAVRYGKMSRDEALEQVRLYDGKISDDLIHDFCDYLGISRQDFDEVVDRVRNDDIWQRSNNGTWEHKKPPA